MMIDVIIDSESYGSFAIRTRDTGYRGGKRSGRITRPHWSTLVRRVPGIPSDRPCQAVIFIQRFYGRHGGGGRKFFDRSPVFCLLPPASRTVRTRLFVRGAFGCAGACLPGDGGALYRSAAAGQDWGKIVLAVAALLAIYIVNSLLMIVVTYWGHKLGISIETEMRRAQLRSSAEALLPLL